MAYTSWGCNKTTTYFGNIESSFSIASANATFLSYTHINSKNNTHIVVQYSNYINVTLSFLQFFSLTVNSLSFSVRSELQIQNKGTYLVDVLNTTINFFILSFIFFPLLVNFFFLFI